jgi:polyketide synthase-associated protein
MPPKKKEAKKEEIDFRLGKDDVESFSFGYDVMQCLLRKGFCVIQSEMAPDEIQKIISGEVQTLYGGGKFKKPPTELVQGLLGDTGSARMAPLEPDECEGLHRIDAQVESFRALIEPVVEDFLGFQVPTRSGAFVLEAGDAPEPAAELTVPEGWKWLNLFQWHRFMCIFFAGPASGMLEMKPFDDFSQTHEVIAQPGMFVILRTDWLSHKFVPQAQSWTLNSFFLETQNDAPLRRKKVTFPMCPAGKALDAWLIGSLRLLKETTETEDEYEALTGREVQRMSNHMYHKGMQMCIRGCTARLPCSSPDNFTLKACSTLGCDGATSVPYKRWNNEHFYRTEPQDGYTTRDTYMTEHGCFIEGIELFDHKFFGLSLNETRGMDPNQRIGLELCYEICYNGGFKKSTLMRSDLGVYTSGQAGVSMEWASVPKTTDEGGALASTSGSPAILSNRLSYTFGMNGPNFLVDLDAAGYLMAMSLATDACFPAKAQCSGAVALGVDIVLAPMAFMHPSWAGLLSIRGRSLVFDHTADGYIRGEGGGGVFVNPLMREIDGEYTVVDNPPMKAIISGFQVNNSGKVATLGAPSGALDQELISTCIRRAEISAMDVDLVECHGMGSLLGDAVEVTALSKTYRSRGGEPQGYSGCKSNFGSLKPAAGIASVSKLLVGMHLGCQLSTIHLHRINPHMLLEDVPVNFITDHVGNPMSSSFTGVTNKGLGGTNVHMILWGEIDTSTMSKYATMPTKREQIVYWPGGGGELMSDAQPRKQYMIVCTSNNFKAEPMQSEGKGTWTYTVTLGDHLTERFQIWLDGDSEKVLHPSKVDADKDMVVYGPDEANDADGSYWLIDGRARIDEYAAALADAGEGEGGAEKLVTEHKDQGLPGTQYQISFSVNGQYRLVTWEKVEVAEGAIVAAPACKYYVIGSWSGFEPEEMAVDESMPGIYYLEAQSLYAIGTFSIVRNKDWHQTIYPTVPMCESPDANPVLGPDGDGRGMEWLLEGVAGDVFRIELQVSLENGLAPMQISWRRVATRPLSPLMVNQKSEGLYSFISSLERWNTRHKMKYAPGRGYVIEIDVPSDGFVAFQILQSGDWGRVFHPDTPEAGARDEYVTKGPSSFSSNCWKVGKYMEEQGGHYEVCLETGLGDVPKVTWQRK